MAAAAEPPEPRLLDVSMAGEVNVVDDDDDEDVDVGELERCDLDYYSVVKISTFYNPTISFLFITLKYIYTV